jgi:hypothetical protein
MANHVNPQCSYHEEQGKPHRWDTILSADYVQNFLDKVVASNTTSLPPSFTLTTSITAESGSLHGFSIRQLELPGALGRLRVESGVGPEVLVNTENVWEFSVDKSSLKPETVLVVDGVEIKIEEGDPTIWLSKARVSRSHALQVKVTRDMHRGKVIRIQMAEWAPPPPHHPFQVLCRVNRFTRPIADHPAPSIVSSLGMELSQLWLHKTLLIISQQVPVLLTIYSPI